MCISNWGIFKNKYNFYSTLSKPWTKTKCNRDVSCWVSRCLPFHQVGVLKHRGLPPQQQDLFHPPASHSLFLLMLLNPKLPILATSDFSHLWDSWLFPPNGNVAESEISSLKHPNLSQTPCAWNSPEQQLKHRAQWTEQRGAGKRHCTVYRNKFQLPFTKPLPSPH